MLDIINYLVNEYNRRYNKDFSFVPYIYLNNEIQQKKHLFKRGNAIDFIITENSPSNNSSIFVSVNREEDKPSINFGFGMRF